MQPPELTQTDLEIIFDKYIKKEDKLCFIKVDDVNVDDIFPGLSKYTYIDYNNQKDIDKIVNSIQSRI